MVRGAPAVRNAADLPSSIPGSKMLDLIMHVGEDHSTTLWPRYMQTRQPYRKIKHVDGPIPGSLPV